MKKLFLGVLAVVLFSATSAMAEVKTLVDGEKKVKTLVDGEKTSCEDCKVIDGKKVMCEKCLAKKADSKDNAN